MCITRNPAKLTNTTLYAAETMVNGVGIHVLGYQNKAEHKSFGGNAMLLPFPTSLPMGPENIIDTRAFPNILKDYAKTIRENRAQSKSFGSRGLRRDDRGVQIFESGSYTVVLADNAEMIPGALLQVPEARRPVGASDIYESLARLYPGWPVAACCFNGRIEPEPLLWWYAPSDPSKLFAPGLDAHDGNPPDLAAQVKMDHTVIFGSNIRARGFDVTFQDQIPEDVAPLLAKKVVGQVFEQTLPNGDFWFPVQGFSDSKVTLTRSAPSGV